MKVWVLDIVGYDTRGGSASVFSTLEKAKAAVPYVNWKLENDGSWCQDHGANDPLDVKDVWTIEEQEVDPE